MPTVLTSVNPTTLYVSRGDSFIVRCTVKSYSTAAAVNIAGFTPWLTVKRNPADDDVDALFQIKGTLVSSGTTGICTFAITSAETTTIPGTYYYDIELTDGTNVKTVVPTSGFIIKWDTTRTTATS